MKKIVILVDEALPQGMAANAAAALAFSAARFFPDGVGPDAVDAEGSVHPGITAVGLPILKASSQDLARIRKEAAGDPDLACLDFSETARLARSYPAYAETLRSLGAAELLYRGLCLIGPRKSVDRHSGSLPLY